MQASIYQLVVNLAQTPANSSTQPSGPTWLTSPLIPMMLVIAVLWIFMTRSKRSQEKQRKQMLDNLKRGDRVQTIGGILGTVVEARESEVLVKVDESSNTKIRFSRAAIHKVVEEEKEKSSVAKEAK